jgi:SAM-dependent methyltransferase
LLALLIRKQTGPQGFVSPDTPTCIQFAQSLITHGSFSSHETPENRLFSELLCQVLRHSGRLDSAVLLSFKMRRLKVLKNKVKSLTAKHFWLRYATLAPYRAVCSAVSACTRITMAGAVHAERSVDEAIAYITSVFNVYRTAAGVERFHGRVAEIGPGDSCGIGLMFMADGCQSVDLVDRFYSARDERHQRAINKALVQQFPGLASLQSNGDFSESSFLNLVRHYGRPAETFFDANRGYDFIVSCAVLEHVYDPLRAVTAMISALKPGGIMVHQVDCRDHGQFSEYFHELKFLELPSTLYSPLKWGGGPNRVRLSSYVSLLQQAPVDFKIYVGSLAGCPEFTYQHKLMQDLPRETVRASQEYVAGIRSRLAMPFRQLSDEDLMVSGFTMSVRKQQPVS